MGVWKIKSSTKPLINTHFTDSTGNEGKYLWGYAFDFSNGVLIHETGRYSNGPQYGSICKEGDVIEMILDLYSFTLRYKINDKDLGIAFEDIEDTQYRGACSSEKHGVKLEMLR